MDTVEEFKELDGITLRVVQYFCRAKMGSKGRRVTKTREVMCGNRTHDRICKFAPFAGREQKKSYKTQDPRSPGNR